MHFIDPEDIELALPDDWDDTVLAAKTYVS